jgi:Raf kinase inhibitor-like YbhB/YbcL family protein
LEIEAISENTKSLVLIVADPDALAGTWYHWLLWNIDPQVSLIEENSISQGAVQGINSFGKRDYGDPCPPSGSYCYIFKLYALDNILKLSEGSSKEDLKKEMSGHILAEAQLIGNYQMK